MRGAAGTERGSFMSGTLRDRYGLVLSTASGDAAARYREGMDRLLAYARGADEAFAAASAADEGFALPHAGQAMLALFVGDGAGARAALGRAQARVGDATRRERQHVAALATMVGGDAVRGLALLDEHLQEFPRDALAANQASSAIGFSGRPDREAYRAAFVERLAPAYGEDWWFDSALSFVYHETGRFDESRRLSERSLARCPANANASHNIAHVCFETLDHDGGTTFLADWLGGYDRGAPYHCHLAWHLALFELHRGHADRALEIHQRDIAPARNVRHALMDGPALLWRFGLYERAVSAPWRALADLGRRATRPGFVFGDIHAALAYAADGDERSLAAIVDSLRALHGKGHPHAGEVALPLVLGAAAFAAGDDAGALAHLEPVEREIHRMGGSHAQWELFEETMVVCYLRLGRHEDATRLLRRRLARRASPQDLRWLERAGGVTPSPPRVR
jgi:tetratricopeptide (TPR) repeat protein